MHGHPKLLVVYWLGLSIAGSFRVRAGDRDCTEHIRTLHLPVISVMLIGVMWLSYNERAVFVRTTYPSRYVYFRWSRVHIAVETAGVVTVIV